MLKLERKITTKYISLFNVKDQEEAAAAAEEGYGASHPWGEVELFQNRFLGEGVWGLFFNRFWGGGGTFP